MIVVEKTNQKIAFWMIVIGTVILVVAVISFLTVVLITVMIGIVACIITLAVDFYCYCCVFY